MILWPPVWQSRCIENRNSSTGAQVIATSQMYRGMYPQMYCQIYLQMYLKMSSQTAIAGVKTSERSPQQSGSGDEVKRANQKYYQKLFKLIWGWVQNSKSKMLSKIIWGWVQNSQSKMLFEIIQTYLGMRSKEPINGQLKLPFMRFQWSLGDWRSSLWNDSVLIYQVTAKRRKPNDIDYITRWL